ncbi:MAG: hypothetical protein WAW75_03670 [Gallionella sp.]
MKICKKCSGSEFYKNGQCKPCHKIAYDKWKAKNPEKIKADTSERTARWRAKNPEKSKSRTARWQKENPEKCRAAQAKYRAAYPERCKASGAKYLAKNSEKKKASQTKRRKDNLHRDAANSSRKRAAKINAIPKWFGELDELIIQEAHSLAKQRTKVTGFKWHVDHEVPLQSKLVCGFHIGCNIQVIPASTNISKGNRHWLNMP